MSLILKNKNLTAGTEKLYRDALVEKGTLSLIDFSNYGCISDGNLETIKDLALESKEKLNIINNINFNVSGSAIVPSLNDKKGFKQSNLGSTSQSSYNTGITIHNIDKYLYDTQPNSMIVLWLDAQGNDLPGNLASDNVLKSGDVGFENIRLTGGPVSMFSLRLGGVGFANYNIPSNVIQVAVEYIDNTQPCKLYVNGKYHALGPSNAYGFKAPSGSNPISLGQKVPNSKGLFNFYRMFIEDLSVSGRSALDVVTKDFNYVNAINEYEGIKKRPYSNI